MKGRSEGGWEGMGGRVGRRMREGSEEGRGGEEWGMEIVQMLNSQCV